MLVVINRSFKFNKDESFFQKLPVLIFCPRELSLHSLTLLTLFVFLLLSRRLMVISCVKSFISYHKNNNYLLHGCKVVIYLLSNPESVLLFERSENNNRTRGITRQINRLYRHAIPNFIFIMSHY